MKNADFEVHPLGVQHLIPRKFRVNNLDFHYSPFTILQTFQWALEPETIPGREDHYIQTADGLTYDPTLDHKASGTREELDIINQHFVENDRQVKICRVVVITLGLVECVHDRETGLYLETWPGKFLKPEDRGRYEIHVLSCNEILTALQKIHAILTRHLPAEFKILLTVSPVPLANTFRDCDVIIANNYSKSSLRAAAEEFSNRHNNVDYLPVYESVMISDRLTAWDVDLRHPSEFIVRLNVLRMLDHYSINADREVRAMDMALIEQEIIDFDHRFQESWPQQLRAFRGNYGALESRLKEHMEKSEALRHSMEEEILALNKIIKRLQNSNTQYLSQLVNEEK